MIGVPPLVARDAFYIVLTKKAPLTGIFLQSCGRDLFVFSC